MGGIETFEHLTQRVHEIEGVAIAHLIGRPDVAAFFECLTKLPVTLGTHPEHRGAAGVL